MKPADIDLISDWIIRRGLEGAQETDLLTRFCEKCNAAGLPMARALVIIDTLHPVHEGTVFRWRNDNVEEDAATQYGRTTEGEAAASWQRSPFYHLLQTGGEELRRRIAFGDPIDFPSLQEMKDLGYTDYIIFVHRFAEDATIGEMDCVYSSWSTRDAKGFSDADIAALRRLAPTLGLAIKSAALAKVADTLVEVYLGRDAGQRVLKGRIQRGVADRIEAALWFSDLRSFTTITDTAKPTEIIPLLNDYAEAVITAIHEAGGDVLKLIGDGTLALFRADDPAEACRRALKAEEIARARVRDLNEKRRGRGAAGHLGLCRPACRRGVLRQYRQRRAARLHRRRAGGQRDQPHRLDVPLGRPADPDLLDLRRRAAERPSAPTWCRSAASPCAASATPRSSSPSIPRPSSFTIREVDPPRRAASDRQTRQETLAEQASGPVLTGGNRLAPACPHRLR